MDPAAPSPPSSPSPPLAPGLPMFRLVVLFAVLLAVILASTVWLSILYERDRRQDQLQRDTEAVAAQIRSRLGETETLLQMLASDLAGKSGGPQGAELFEQVGRATLSANPALLRIEQRLADGSLVSAVNAEAPRPELGDERRRILSFEASLALRSALEFHRPLYSRSYYVQLTTSSGFEVIELAVPIAPADPQSEPDRALLAVYAMPRVLEHFTPADFLKDQRLWATDVDGTFVARALDNRAGAAVYAVAVPLELAGATFQLRAASLLGSPPLIPNLLTGLLILVTLALGATGLVLWRDVRLRLDAERQLREQHAFREAMEDSLVTGLRARNLEGHITYVNPAFCAMTGYTQAELIGHAPPMPYWAPEVREDYENRRADILAGNVSREGFETVYVRRSGERFAVLIFEAPLIDASGRQTGWMSSVLDVAEQKRIEELSRRQQEKLQANSRLSVLGEVATAMSHELNQPLAAITSYATACQNLLAHKELPPALGHALAGIRAQSERAGAVIRSVQQFVRRRALDHEPIVLAEVLSAIAPLIQLQARKAGARLAWHAPAQAIVIGDQLMIEQVVLNLTRNALEAMDETPARQREVTIDVTIRSAASEAGSQGLVEMAVADRGKGVPEDRREQLFTPFFSTKPDGMGIGLSLCRSVVERLGGHMDYQPRAGGGSIFLFCLPLAAPAGTPPGSTRPLGRGAIA